MDGGVDPMWECDRATRSFRAWAWVEDDAARRNVSAADLPLLLLDQEPVVLTSEDSRTKPREAFVDGGLEEGLKLSDGTDNLALFRWYEEEERCTGSDLGELM